MPDSRAFRTRRQFLAAAAAGVAGTATGLTFLYTWRVEPHWLEVVHRELPVEHLPADLVGKTLVHLSDTHIGPEVDDDYLLHTFERVEALRPDLVVFTGDLVTYRGRGEVEQARRVLRRFPRGRLATVSVLGNHDYGSGWSQLDVAAAVESLLTDAGCTVLRNSVAQVAGLQLAGVDDFWSPSFDPRTPLRALDPRAPSVLLCHNPDAMDLPVWEGYRGWILAGHTHGGQCKPPFLPPPILPVRNKRYTAGHIPLANGRNLYISRGIGHLLRVRFNVRPEVTVFSLVQA